MHRPQSAPIVWGVRSEKTGAMVRFESAGLEKRGRAAAGCRYGFRLRFGPYCV
jgi:hypothetical protein